MLLNNANDPVLRYEIIQDLNKLNIKQKLNSVTSTAHDFLTQKKFLLDQLAEDFSGEITNPVEITKMIASNMTVEGLNILKDILHMFLQLSAQRKLYNFGFYLHALIGMYIILSKWTRLCWSFAKTLMIWVKLSQQKKVCTCVISH